MKCYLVDGKGIDHLTMTERTIDSHLGLNDVLVDVKACSLNYRDLIVAKGEYSQGSFPPFIPLSDMSGVVKAVGERVTDLKVGDRVLNAPFRHWPAGEMRSDWMRTFVGGAGVDGVLAEQVVYPADALIKVPDFLSFVEASTFTIAGLTAWSALVSFGRVLPGDWVLLHGTGGVSIFAAQIARIMGARVILTTGSAQKGEFVKKQLGVHKTLNYQDPHWSKQVKEITEGRGVDVVVDVAGGETFANSLKCCGYGARVAAIGILDNREVKLKIMDLIVHQILVKGIYMESTEELRAFMRAVETSHLKPFVDKTFSFSDAKEAYRYMESQKHIGKIAITI